MKKIIAIVSASLVAILLAVTIVLACTKFTAKTVLKYDKAWAMEIYNTHNSTDPMTVKSDNEIFKEIIKRYKESLKENNISALFQGAKGFDETVNNKEVAISEIVNLEDGDYVFNIMYEEKQTLKWDGKDYVNPNSTTKETVKFDSLYVEVKNTANFTEYNIYLAENGSSYSNWNVSLIAHQDSLFSYIGDLKYQY